MQQLFPLRPVVEEDRVTYRKHWFVLVRTIWLPLALLIIDIVVWVHLRPLYTPFSFYQHSSWLGTIVLLLSLFPIVLLWWRYENWRNDYYVITRDRIIDVNKLPLGFRSHTREAPLRNVQNVSMKIPNFLGAALDFGNIEVDTAGKEGQLTFQYIHHPRRVLNDVTSRTESFRAHQAELEKARRGEEIVDWLTAFADLSRVTVVRNPHHAQVAEKVDIEWRVSGSSADVETCIRWDFMPRPDRAYQYASPPQYGGTGNYAASLLIPLATKLYFRIFAKIDGADYWSAEHGMAVSDFAVSFPPKVKYGDAIKVEWHMNAQADSAKVLWDVSSHQTDAYQFSEESDKQGTRYTSRLTAPDTQAIYFRLRAQVEKENLYSQEFVTAIVRDGEFG